VVVNPNPHPLKSFSIGRFCASEGGLAGVPAFSFTGEISPKRKKKKVLKKKASKLENEVVFRSLTSVARSEGGIFNSHISSFYFL
jgi:hypothetical protein